MTTTTPPTPPTATPRRPPMPRMPNNRVAPTKPKPVFKLTFQKPEPKADKIVIYGSGGVGKTTFASYIPGKTVFFDLDDSLSKLTGRIPEVLVQPCDSWADLLAALNADGWDGIDNIVIDSGTKAQELCTDYTMKTMPPDKTKAVALVEDYGWGKGYQYVYDIFLTLFGPLDRHARQGRNIILVCHDCTIMKTNPGGDNYPIYQPRLQDPSKGKASICLRVREWCDQMFFIDHDVVIDAKGKAKGSGTRSLYTVPMPFCMAKNRGLDESLAVVPLDMDNIPEIWNQILGRESE